jgi:hypothetical protein
MRPQRLQLAERPRPHRLAHGLPRARDGRLEAVMERPQVLVQADVLYEARLALGVAEQGRAGTQRLAGGLATRLGDPRAAGARRRPGPRPRRAAAAHQSRPGHERIAARIHAVVFVLTQRSEVVFEAGPQLRQGLRAGLGAAVVAGQLDRPGGAAEQALDA